MIAIIIITAILWHIIIALVVYFLFNKQSTEHETQLKELEILFNNRIGEDTKIIVEYEDYILKYQHWYTNFTEAIRVSKLRLEEIDLKGSFKSDDEVGFFFKNLKEIQDTLNTFDYTKPQIKKEEPPKAPLPSPIDEHGKSNVIVLTQEQAAQLAGKA